MLGHADIRAGINRADGMARSMLRNSDPAKQASAQRAHIYLEWAKGALDDGDEWRAFGLLCFACGMVNGDGSKGDDMPWIFGEKEKNPDGQPQQLELAITGITGAQLLGQL